VIGPAALILVLAINDGDQRLQLGPVWSDLGRDEQVFLAPPAVQRRQRGCVKLVRLVVG
jgi:hypothetical protein